MMMTPMTAQTACLRWLNSLRVIIMHLVSSIYFFDEGSVYLGCLLEEKKYKK